MSHINLYTKLLGQRSAGKPHAALDVAGAGNVPLGYAPVLDPTAERRLKTERDLDCSSTRHRVRRRLY